MKYIKLTVKKFPKIYDSEDSDKQYSEHCYTIYSKPTALGYTKVKSQRDVSRTGLLILDTVFLIFTKSSVLTVESMKILLQLKTDDDAIEKALSVLKQVQGTMFRTCVDKDKELLVIPSKELATKLALYIEEEGNKYIEKATQ